jgi:hypothetical protein
MVTATTVIVAMLGSYYAYRSYKEQVKAPNLFLALYATQGSEETWYRDMSVRVSEAEKGL